jgi:hypothetical protein
VAPATTQPRHNRTLPVDFRDEATSCRLLGDGQASLEFVVAFGLALGFPLPHTAPCHGGGCLTRHAHEVRIRRGGLPIGRLPCTTCRAGFTVLPHFVWR